MSVSVESLVPSWFAPVDVHVVADGAALDDVDALAVPVPSSGPVPPVLGLSLDALRRAGFSPAVGSALGLPRADGPALVAVGIGDVEDLTSAAVRDAAAAFARSVPQDSALATRVPHTAALAAADAAAAIVEGVLLARYRFDLRSSARPSDPVAVRTLVLVAPRGQRTAVEEGAARGLVTARVGMLSRDLAACPAFLLTAEAMAQVAVEIGGAVGLDVAVFDRAALTELGCGGLLGVNRGSAREPAMIRMSYAPAGAPTGHLGLVGKGIMYDAGGINLKPSDESHSQMKNDMTGAGAILAAMVALPALGCPAQVTAWLMCTDNMLSGTAMQLGDVLTRRGGTTVEVLNTDAEGRLVMADALVLAVEAGVDAIVDIATLTGAALRTFGTEVAAVMGNSPAVVAAVRAAGDAVDEPAWELPLIARYRPQLVSDIADLKNMGGMNAGSITAALFLEAFVSGTPWAHIDIAGTGQSPVATRWVNKGPTGFGARLLAELAVRFSAPVA